MSRFLFVVPPFAGHTNPTVSVAGELAASGHEVAWVGHRAAVGQLLPEGASLHALDAELPAGFLEELGQRARTLRGLAGLKFLWEDVLLPLARSMLPGVRAAVERLRPDVLVVDQQALAGALVARAGSLPWATFATTSAERRDSLLSLPTVGAWTDERLAELQREAGLEPVGEPENSPQLVVVFSTPALAGAERSFPSQYRFVGPATVGRPQACEFPWQRLDGRRALLVSLGTLNAERGARFFAAAAEALGEEQDLQVVCVAPASFGPFPDNFLVQPRVPQVALLPRLSGVVCHAGHNTVCEALSQGLPLVVAPIKDDQPVVAQQIVDAGCGLRLSFTRPRPEQLRSAVRRILDEPSFAEAAARVRDSFEAAGGARAAARHLEELL